MEYTANHRLATWLRDGCVAELSGYILVRYGVHVASAAIESWRQAYMAEWGLKSMPFMSDPAMWLKKRLAIPAGPGEWVDRVEFNDLHVFPLHWERVECKLDQYEIAAIKWCLKRLSESRSAVSVLSERMARPIDRTAARVVRDEAQACPWCREWFRNPNALAIHADERHGQCVVVA